MSAHAKGLLLGATSFVLLGLTGSASVAQNGGPPDLIQGPTVAQLIADGFEIKAGLGGNLLLQRKTDAYHCLTFRMQDSLYLGRVRCRKITT